MNCNHLNSIERVKQRRKRQQINMALFDLALIVAIGLFVISGLLSMQ